MKYNDCKSEDGRAKQIALYLTLRIFGLLKVALRLFLVLLHGTLFVWRSSNSPAVQAATERSLFLDVKLLNHRRRQGSERWGKENQSSTQSLSSLHSQHAYTVAEAKMLKLV